MPSSVAQQQASEVVLLYPSRTRGIICDWRLRRRPFKGRTTHNRVVVNLHICLNIPLRTFVTDLSFMTTCEFLTLFWALLRFSAAQLFGFGYFD